MGNQFKYLFIFLFCVAIAISCKVNKDKSESNEKAEWVTIFDGKSLDGWTPKFKGYPLGENYKNTFGVRNGVIYTTYDEYTTFDENFGHLFYKNAYSHYKLRLEYRVIGKQCPDGPGWAFKNSGVMYHCQDPKTMEIDQNFPICLEGQFLGGDGTNDRPSGNLCTPNTHVTIDGKLVKEHCINSTAVTVHDESWVTAEFIILGDEKIHHMINGDTVFTFTNPIYDLPEPVANVKFKDGDPVKGGYFALQAESHPYEFKNIQILNLKK